MTNLKADLKPYLNFSLLRFSFDTFLLWLSVAVCLFLAVHFNTFWSYLIAYLFIGSRQLAISHMVHSASHFHFHRNKWLNDLIGDLLFASPVLITTESYRDQHVLHHRHTGISTKDSDERAWYNIKGFKFLIKMLFAICGGEAIRTISSYKKTNSSLENRFNKIRHGLLVIGTHSIIVSYCFFIGNIWAYMLVWLLPLITITPLLITLRVIAEHQPVEYSFTGKDNPEKSFEPPLTRTVNGGVWGRYFLGSFNFCYHHEHHLYPAINYQQLPAFHKELMSYGYYKKHPEALSESYYSTLKNLIFPKRDFNACL